MRRGRCTGGESLRGGLCTGGESPAESSVSDLFLLASRLDILLPPPREDPRKTSSLPLYFCSRLSGHSTFFLSLFLTWSCLLSGRGESGSVRVPLRISTPLFRMVWWGMGASERKEEEENTEDSQMTTSRFNPVTSAWAWFKV